MLLHIVDKKRYIYADFSGVLWASVKMCEQVSTTSVLFVQGPVLCFVIFHFFYSLGAHGRLAIVYRPAVLSSIRSS